MVGEHIKWYTPAQKRDETAPILTQPHFDP